MKIARIIKSNYALTHEQGEIVRDKIIKALYFNKRVTLDCSGLHLIASHFICPIVELINLYPQDRLRDSVRFTNISKFHAQHIHKCIANALKNKSKRDKRS